MSSGAGALLRTDPSTDALRTSVMMLGGLEVASMDVDAAWTNKDTCSRIPGLAVPPLPAARLLYKGDMISGETSLCTSGVEDCDYLQLFIVLCPVVKCLCLCGVCILLAVPWPGSPGLGKGGAQIPCALTPVLCGHVF